VVVQDGQVAGFGGDVQAAGGWVVGEHVRLVAYLAGAGDLPGDQVEGEQAGVAVAGDEREPGGRVEGQAVVVVAAGQCQPAGDGEGGRVDVICPELSGQLICG
jgi:hypothetical protein